VKKSNLQNHVYTSLLCAGYVLPMCCLCAPRNSEVFLGAHREHSRSNQGAGRRYGGVVVAGGLEFCGRDAAEALPAPVRGAQVWSLSVEPTTLRALTLPVTPRSKARQAVNSDLAITLCIDTPGR
jgi:hypothetical protein